jgi:hypothetical protein
MSFGTLVRKVRDESVPYGRRVSALACGVYMYRPLGFQATFAYVTDRTGRFRYDEAALLQAIERLEKSRALWQAEVTAFVEMRRDAKREGRRQPKRSDGNPFAPDHWYGDRRGGALFALQFMLTSRHSSDARSRADAGVKRLATHCLDSGGVLDGAHQRRYRELREAVELRRAAARGSDVQRSEWDRATDSLRFLVHIGNAAAGSGVQLDLGG